MATHLTLITISGSGEFVKYRVLGTTSDDHRFDIEVFAACPREAEVFVSLRAMCQEQQVSIAGVLDVSRQSVHCTDMPAPELQNFRAMLCELQGVLRAGNISFSASSEYQWLCSVIDQSNIDRYFFRHCEKRLANASGNFDQIAGNEISERLIRLAAIGVSLLESRSVPQTQNLFDLMWQVRVTAIIYGPILLSGFKKPHLKVVHSGC